MLPIETEVKWHSNKSYSIGYCWGRLKWLSCESGNVARWYGVVTRFDYTCILKIQLQKVQPPTLDPIFV